MLDRTSRLRRKAGIVVTLTTAAVLLASCGDTGPDNGQNVLRPAGPAAEKILDLTEPFFWVAVAIGSFVLFGTIYVAVRFRARPGDDEAGPKQVHGNTVLEVSWTIIPALILAVMAVPTIATIFDLAERPKGDDVVDIRVIGKQWWWEYHYRNAAGDDIMVTANEMHIPIDRPVYLTLESDNVIHSFWIPELAGKKDVVPGHQNHLTLEASEPGTYLGQCAEYCGLSHANMRMRVIAHTDADYDEWFERQLEPLSASSAAFVQETLGTKWGCTSCHSFDPTKAGATAPNLTHLADREGFAGDIYDTNFENLWKWVHDAPSRKPMEDLDSAMPNFSAQGMTDAEAKEIAEFLLCQTGTQPSAQHPECS
jgi:cytochrome c oxidase subunit 2